MPWRVPHLHAGCILRPWRPCRPAFAHHLRRYESTYDKPISASSNEDADSSSSSASDKAASTDSDLSDLGRLITDDFATLRAEYKAPQHPIVLAHGLMGFDELRLAGRYLPGIRYWRGIKDAFARHGIECITTAVPTTGSIADRAAAMAAQIAAKVPQPGTPVNIVAHSMGGLDARYMISRVCPPRSAFQVASLTTIATPHRGSSAADMLFRDILGPELVPRIYRVLERLKVDAAAFTQLTTTYVTEHFNPSTPNDPAVAYYSYGAAATPHLLSVFRLSHDLMRDVEGPNDGLVSVRSAKWGVYRGTLVGVTHLDLINWSNRIKTAASRLGLMRENFNAVAFYLAVADGLAKEGF